MKDKMEKHLNLDLANRYLQNRHLVDVTIYSSIDDEAAEVLSGYRGSILPLMSLKTITSSVAESLSKYRGGHLDLSGLTILGDDVAEKLGEYVGVLDLSGIKKLSVAEAKSLGEHKGRLYLSGLTTMCVEVAKELSACDADYIELSSLEELGGDAAICLSRFPNRLKLGSRCLSVESALGLSDHTGKLVLESVESIDEDVLYHLSWHKGNILIESPLQTIPDTWGHTAFVERLIADHAGRILNLADVTKIGTGPAKSVSRHRGPLNLKSLSEMDYETANSIAGYFGTLEFPNLICNEDIANGLINHSGKLEICVDGISDACAGILSKHRGPLYVLGLTMIDDTEGYLALMKKLVQHDLSKSVSCIKNLTDSASEIISRFSGDINLKGLTYLTDTAAEHLSRHDGGALNLSGLKDLTDTAAERLSRHQGRSLILSGLKEIGETAAQHLSRHGGKSLNLSGLIQLSDVSTESLSRYNGGILDLSGLREISENASARLASSNITVVFGALSRLEDNNGHLELLDKIIEQGSFKCLSSLEYVGDVVAQKLSGYIGSKLYLEKIKVLNDTPGHLQLAEALFTSEHNRQRLYLSHLEAMGDEVASRLARYNRWEVLSLYSLKSLDDCPGHLSFIISLFRNNSLISLNLESLQKVGDLCKFLLVEYKIHAEIRLYRVKLILPHFNDKNWGAVNQIDGPFTDSDDPIQDYSRIFTPIDDPKDEDLPF